jgi:hypothetical protein
VPSRYINPATGSDNNNGTSPALAWASTVPAVVYITANPGVLDHLYIDTSIAPLYVSSSALLFFGAKGIGLTITSANADPADIRCWQLIEGSTAVLYDTYYSTTGHPNIYVLVTRQDACIWEFMGGRGDNLKWLDHAAGATYDNATLLTTLNTTAWTWWTGTDGSNYVTIFNPNGSPAGRQFAVPYNPGQNVVEACIEIEGGTINNLCIGGLSGCAPDGTGLAGTVCQAKNGATLSNNIFYGGGSHLGLFGAGAACTMQNNVWREGPSWMGAGGYSTCVWYSADAATNPPVHTGDTCLFVFSTPGQVRGRNFPSVDLGLANSMGQSYLAHNINGNTNAITMTNCYFGGLINIKTNLTNSTLGSLYAGTAQSSTVLYVPTNQSVDVTYNDCLILLNIAAVNASHYCRLSGSCTLQSCTIISQDFMNGVVAAARPIFDTSQAACTLTINDCIFNLVGSAGQGVQLTNSMDLDATDVLTANRNIYLTSDVIHVALTASSSTSNRTLAQTQSIGYEASSITDVTNATTKLNSSSFTVPKDSVAVGMAAPRSNAPDRTGIVFASRLTTGAFEYFNLAGSSNVGTKIGLSL